MNPPRLTIVAGPNGSGKSTLIHALMGAGVDFGYYINADDIARQRGLEGDAGARIAQAAADEEREDCLRQGGNFSFETVMSHGSKIEFMKKARDAGYEILFCFVATGDPLVNVQRVRNRVGQGGHSVPEDRIVARYHRTLDLLPAAMAQAQKSVVFDNSSLGNHFGTQMFREVITSHSSRNGVEMKLHNPFPAWAFSALRLRAFGYGLEEFGPSNIFRFVPEGRLDSRPLSDEKVIDLARKLLGRL